MEALKNLLDQYVSLVNSGDAGSWDPETEAVVVAARKALAAIPAGYAVVPLEPTDAAYKAFWAGSYYGDGAWSDGRGREWWGEREMWRNDFRNAILAEKL